MPGLGKYEGNDVGNFLGFHACGVVALLRGLAQVPPVGWEQEGAEFIDGSMVIDHERLRLPTQLLEEEGNGNGFWPDPVFTVVVTLALAFTAFVAFLIATHVAEV